MDTKRHRPKGLSIFLLAAAAVIAFSVFWDMWSKRQPEFTLPPKQMPSPNAYDFYKRAFEAMPREPIAKNAFPGPMSKDASPMMPQLHASPPPTLEQRLLSKPTDPSISLSQKLAVLKKYEKSLNIFLEGLKYNYAAPLYPDQEQIGKEPRLSRTRDFTRVVGVQREVYAEQGQYAKATDTIIDGLQLGIDTGNNVVFPALVGVAVDAMILTRKPERFVSRLSAAECRAAAARLERVRQRRFSPAQVMAEDRLTSLAELQGFLKDPKWRMAVEYSYDYDSEHEVTVAERVGRKLRSYTFTKRSLFKFLDQKSKAAISRAELPYCQMKTTSIDTRGPYGFLPDIAEKVSLKIYADTASVDLLLLSLALRAYKLERGAYPQTLQQLVPGYLKSIPNDPFGQGVYVYKPKGDAYLLYSLGPDCRDDGGGPLNTQYVGRESVGDIVAGVK